jgi:hypothetical protein
MTSCSTPNGIKARRTGAGIRVSGMTRSYLLNA